MTSFRPIIAPSLLAANHAHLGAGAQQVAQLGLEWLHLDIMDGHFVPNLTFGPQTVKDLRQETPDLFFDVHLMLERPDLYIEPFAKAGADLISIHIEPEYNVLETLKKIRKLGCKNGIAMNPDCDPKRVEKYLEYVDLVLIMTVFPGQGGQKFIESTLSHVEWVSKKREQMEGKFQIEVDGGINLETAERCWKAGADTYVIGTAFFGAQDKKQLIQRIQNMS